MQTNVIDIIVYLARQLYLGTPLKEVDQEPLKYYNRAEIGAAYSWLIQHQKESGKSAYSDLISEFAEQWDEPRMHRLLHPAEAMILTPKLHGYLLELLHIGLIDPLQMEQIIENVMLHYNEPLKLPALKTMIAETVFGKETDRRHGLYLTGDETIH